MSYNALYLLREDVLFRRFPDSIVAFHPDTGDTLMIDSLCGSILELLRDAGHPLAAEEISAQMALRDPDHHLQATELIEDSLAALELHDLVRAILH